ncbi:MAG: phenylalanine--tRNA ligase subunit beta [Simkaniaceae bacterium]|nr:MAG: phenylalanine--tRNA ligase subunit beta [Simkaniaceae bacterium]
MRVPLSWLKDYVKLELSNDELSDILTLAGLEVDKVEPTPFSFKGVVVGEVKETKPHPNADKLKVAQVFDGSETLQIVCGDPKCAVGMKVALATIGGVLTDKEGKTFKIKKSKLRDVESFGMLCAEDELGLAENSDGIMVLSEDSEVGADLTELLGDVIFEISLTPNLGHCMSMVGMARDVAALLDQKGKKPPIHLESGKERCDVTVNVKDSENCYRYSCRKIRGVKVGPPPEWMQRRLENAGVRSINNIVDVTNYVMLEVGQPLHAFDAKKVQGQKISIQSTEKEITFKTLDGEKRKIPSNILMIHDQKGPIAVAGVMGGADSEVDEKTSDIILEAAHFNPSAVRRGSKALGLRSESSARFERGVDFEMVTVALDRAAGLIAELGHGSVDEGKVDIVAKDQKKRKIKVRLSRTNEILGTKLSLNEIESFLKRLEMEVKAEGETLTVVVPSYRNDIHYEIDLIEEVARIFGYNNIKKREARVVNSPLPHAPIYLMEREVRERLIGSGLQEFLTCDLISPQLSELSIEKSLGEKEEIHVLRPSSVDQSILRTSFLPGMLQAVKHNFDRQNEDLSVFEVGKIHFKDGDHFRERLTAAILLTGKVRSHHWGIKAEEVDFFDLKGIIENLLEGFHVSGESFEPTRLKSFHPGIQGEITAQGLRLGVLGEVHPNRLKRLGIERKVFYAQIDLHDLMSVAGKDKKMTSLPQFPGSDRDWTVTLHHDVPLGKVFQEIKAFHSKLLKEYYLLDLYESEKLGKDKKNVTFRFTYRSEKQTVEQAQVEKEHERLVGEITKKFRDFIS